MARAMKSLGFRGPLLLIPGRSLAPPLGRAHAFGHDLLTPLLDAPLFDALEKRGRPSSASSGGRQGGVTLESPGLARDWFSSKATETLPKPSKNAPGPLPGRSSEGSGGFWEGFGRFGRKPVRSEPWTF